MIVENDERRGWWRKKFMKVKSDGSSDRWKWRLMQERLKKGKIDGRGNWWRERLMKGIIDERGI